MFLKKTTPFHIVSCLTVFILLLSPDLSWGAEKVPTKPSKQDKCPVCGMFVYKYPEWVGQIVFKDGSYAFFDGAKDLFKYYFNLKKYNPQKTRADIESISVTEYYDIQPVAAQSAWFVVGSDVYGPMGKELIPVSNETGAREFLKDHKGKRILRFKEITPSILEKLD
jgi:nitrous oxide reductase accessory protein NosL